MNYDRKSLLVIEYLQVIEYEKENQVRWYGYTIFEVTSNCIDGWLIPSIKAKSRISAQKPISEGSIFSKLTC